MTRLRSSIAVGLIVLLAAPGSFAQETPQQTALVRKGTIKIWTGMALIGAGALTMPVTGGSVRSPQDNHDSVWATTGIGLFSAGGALIWWGWHDRRKALNPQTTVNVRIGKSSGVEISRRW